MALLRLVRGVLRNLPLVDFPASGCGRDSSDPVPPQGTNPGRESLMSSIRRTPVAALAAWAAVASLGMAHTGSAHAATPMVRISPAHLVSLQKSIPARQLTRLSQLLKVSRASLAGLNPQPLPPLRISVLTMSKIKQLNPAIAAGLNPQPLPPAPANKGGAVSLNPQPLPPVAALGGAVSLNPQPLPPGRSDLGSAVSLNPQPLPPG